ALGAVVHEMLVGESPFAAASRQAVLQRVLFVQPIALATRRADVPPPLSAAVFRALAKRPDDRFPSAAAFVAQLESRVEPVSPAYTGPEQGQSRAGGISMRTALYLAGVTLVLGLGLGFTFARSTLVQSWLTPARSWANPPAEVGVQRWPLATDAGLA